MPAHDIPHEHSPAGAPVSELNDLNRTTDLSGSEPSALPHANASYSVLTPHAGRYRMLAEGIAAARREIATART